MVLLNNVVSGRKPLKEQKNKGNEERYIYIYIFCGRDSGGKGEGCGAGEGRRRKRKAVRPFPCARGFSSCKRLTQPFHASESIQFPHPNSNRIHGNRRGFLFSAGWGTIERNRDASYPTVAN